MTSALPGPQPVATDSSNSRAHRQQIAGAVNSLLKKVFENNTNLHTQIVALNTAVTGVTASISSEATIRASADTAEATLRTALAATVTTNASTAAAAVTAEATARASADTAFASSLSSVSTTVGTNTANITSLTTSVNGIYAMWGVELDINGNVIGRVKLDGTGGTSEFSVAASKFTVYDGVSTTPAFQISGGVAYLNVPLVTNAVATGMVQNNAITEDDNATNPLASASALGTPFLVASVTFNVSSGGFCFAQSIVGTITVGGGTSGILQYYVDGSPVLGAAISGAIINPILSAGSHTIALYGTQSAGTVGNWQVNNYGIDVKNFKK